MSPEQYVAWKRLAAAVKRAAHAETLDAREGARTELARAMARTWKARRMGDALGAEFVRLLGFAKLWGALDEDGRRSNVAPMLATARTCREMLQAHRHDPEALTAPPPQRPFRADIDG